MTNEEAKALLLNISAYDIDSQRGAEKQEALEMAIAALEAQPEDYTKLKREFLRMASYIDVLLECSDAQKETLLGFISRLAEFMPWTERD